MTYKVVRKKDRNAVYASGFSTIERANKWLEHYNPLYWTDKTVQREDLEIVEDSHNV